MSASAWCISATPLKRAGSSASRASITGCAPTRLVRTGTTSAPVDSARRAVPPASRMGLPRNTVSRLPITSKYRTTRSPAASIAWIVSAWRVSGWWLRACVLRHQNARRLPW